MDLCGGDLEFVAAGGPGVEVEGGLDGDGYGDLLLPPGTFNVFEGSSDQMDIWHAPATALGDRQGDRSDVPPSSVQVEQGLQLEILDCQLFQPWLE